MSNSEASFNKRDFPLFFYHFQSWPDSNGHGQTIDEYIEQLLIEESPSSVEPIVDEVESILRLSPLPWNLISSEVNIHFNNENECRDFLHEIIDLINEKVGPFKDLGISAYRGQMFMRLQLACVAGPSQS